MTDGAGLSRQVDAARYNSFRLEVRKGRAAVSSAAAECDALETVDLVVGRAGQQIQGPDGSRR